MFLLMFSYKRVSSHGFNQAVSYLLVKVKKNKFSNMFVFNLDSKIQLSLG